MALFSDSAYDSQLLAYLQSLDPSTVIDKNSSGEAQLLTAMKAYFARIGVDSGSSVSTTTYNANRTTDQAATASALTAANTAQTTANNQGTTIATHTNQIAALTATAIQPYLGQVATRAYIASKVYTNQVQTMSRSYHFAKQNITSLQVGIANWFVAESDGTNAEVNATANATITASIEYPLGTFTQLKFGGIATATGLPGTNTITDALSIAIPKNAKFYVRIFRTCTNCIYTFPQPHDTPNGDACEIFSTATGVDKTMSGTIGTGFSEGFFPSFIIAQTSRPSSLIFGDSRAVGQHSYITDPSGNQGNIAPSVGSFFAYINAGCSGDAVQHFIASNAKRVSLMQYVSNVIIAYGTNDIAAFGRSAANVIADLITMAGLFPTKKVFVCTIEPRSTDATTVGGSNTASTTINTALRSGLAGTDGHFDIADVVSTARDSGLWKTGYSTDFVHGNSAGTIAIKDSGIINPGVLLL